MTLHTPTHSPDEPMSLLVSWGFIVGMLRSNVDAVNAVAALRRNDRVDPTWRESIPDETAGSSHPGSSDPGSSGASPVVPWAAICRMLREGVAADTAGALIRLNDELDPQWRGHIPEAADSSDDGSDDTEAARDDAGRVVAPFSASQVTSLNGFQRSGFMHPFTCPHDHTTVVDASFPPARALRDDEDPFPFSFDHVRLVADTDGWWCPAQTCTYTQTWAHRFMADGSWRAAHDRFVALFGR